jgi:hypothetical protein
MRRRDSITLLGGSHLTSAAPHLAETFVLPSQERILWKAGLISL